MKKINGLLCFLLSAGMLCGCTKQTVDTFANVSEENTTVNTGKTKGLTVGEIYQNIYDNDKEAIDKYLLNEILKSNIDFTNETNSNLYKKYVREYFEETFVNSDDYKVNNEFNEELLVKYLKSESYNITAGTTASSELLGSTFTYDYSDYIEKEVNSEVYLKILKVNYIINNKAKLLDKNMGRRISYYTVSRSSTTDYSTLAELENYLESINANDGTEEFNGYYEISDANRYTVEYVQNNEGTYLKVNEEYYEIEEANRYAYSDSTYTKSVTGNYLKVNGSYYEIVVANRYNKNYVQDNVGLYLKVTVEDSTKYFEITSANRYNHVDADDYYKQSDSGEYLKITEWVRNLEDIAKLDVNDALETLGTEIAKIGTDSDSSFTNLNKYTKCENDVRCNIDDGKAYQKSLVTIDDYYITELVTKNDEDILYEGAREILFSSNINDYLIKIGNKNFLVAPIYINDETKSLNDAILYDSTNSKYYLVEVEVINSESSTEDKIELAEALVDKISDTTILEECFENKEVSIYDKELRELFIETYGEYNED